MVKLTLEGRDFEVVNFHDVDVVSYFPEAEPNVNGVVKCLHDVFQSEEADAILNRMTIDELLHVWEEWARESNFEYVYRRVSDIVHDDRRRKLRLGFIVLGSWLLTGVIAIVALVLLLV